MNKRIFETFYAKRLNVLKDDLKFLKKLLNVRKDFKTFGVEKEIKQAA